MVSLSGPVTAKKAGRKRKSTPRRWLIHTGNLQIRRSQSAQERLTRRIRASLTKERLLIRAGFGVTSDGMEDGQVLSL